MTIKDLSYATINGVNPLHLIINKINGYIGKSNGNKCFMLVHKLWKKSEILLI